MKGVDLGLTAMVVDFEGWDGEGLRAAAALEAKRIRGRRAKALYCEGHLGWLSFEGRAMHA